jgi:hypothetical protein
MTSQSTTHRTRRVVFSTHLLKNHALTQITPDSNVKWCRIMTATIQDKSSREELGSATAYYVNTAWLRGESNGLAEVCNAIMLL